MVMTDDADDDDDGDGDGDVDYDCCSDVLTSIDLVLICTD
jgi:hypothetical protein